MWKSQPAVGCRHNIPFINSPRLNGFNKVEKNWMSQNLGDTYLMSGILGNMAGHDLLKQMVPIKYFKPYVAIVLCPISNALFARAVVQ